MTRASARNLILGIALAALAGCGGASKDKSLDSLDAELLDTGGNAAVASALNDQIMVDPSLSAQSNLDAIRPPRAPYSAQVPPDDVASRPAPPPEDLLHVPAPVAAQSCAQCDAAKDAATLGALAGKQDSGCAADLTYSARWAARLPKALPLYPGARVSEAAGSEKAPCALRAVSFSTSQPMNYMLDWYYTRAIRGGYDAEHQSDGTQHVLGGTRKGDGAAYVLYMTSRPDGGTDIDLVANKGI